MLTPPDLTDPGDPEVVQSLTRRCSICKVPRGAMCLCALHTAANHTLASCPTSTGRLVHHGRLRPTPKGGD